MIKKENKRIMVTVSNRVNSSIETICKEFGMSISQVANLLILRGLKDVSLDNYDVFYNKPKK